MSGLMAGTDRFFWVGIIAAATLSFALFIFALLI
jgi:hypothetical protein